MSKSKVSENDSQSPGESAISNEIRLGQIVRSDALAALCELRRRVPVLRQLTDEPLHLRLVLDANIVQRELRWRLRSRKRKEARSALHEVINSGTVVPFAPTALVLEIEEHIAEIARYAQVSEEQAQEEWVSFRNLIHFHEPELSTVQTECVDPDDVPYKQVCIELGAHAVYTKDSHFKSMDVPIIVLDLDQVFREYARANSVRLAVNIGSAFTLTMSIGVLKELLRLSVQGVRRVPMPVKVAFVVALAAALIHSRSRTRMIDTCRTLWSKFNNPEFKTVLSSLIVQFAEAHQIAKTASKEIEASLPKPRKRCALVYAREICVIDKTPLPLAEIETRMIAAGYVTRSRAFGSYLRRLLHRTQTFVEVSPGMWTLRATSSNACTKEISAQRES